MAIEAPFYSANDLNSQPGNPALGGGGLDITNKNPFESLNNTITQLTSENAAAQEAKKQRVFQQQQAQERYKQDALARADEYAHQDAVEKWKANQAFVQQVYSDSMSGQINPYNHTDAQGNPVQFAPPEGHSQALSDAADALNKSVTSNPGAAWNPDIRKQYGAFKQMSANSGAAAVQLATLKQQLAQTSDPDEQKNLQASINQINKTPPTQMVDAHLPVPKKTDPLPSLTDEYGKDYNKAMESFTTDEGDMLGRPTVDFKKIKYAQPLTPEYEAALNGVTQLIQKKDPILTDPTAFAALQEQANNIWQNKRGQKDQLNLGKIAPDGTVVLNTSKQGLLDIATAFHLQKDGDLWQDPDADSDEDKALKSANIAHVRAETQALTTGKPKPATLHESADEHDAENTIKRVKDIYGPARYTGPGTPMTYIDKDKDGKDVTKYIAVDGVNLAPILEGKGLDPKDWGVFNSTNLPDVSDMIGVEKTTPEQAANGQLTGKESRSGKDTPADKVFAIKNKQTGDVRLVYLKKVPKDKDDNDKTDKYTPLAIVEGRQAAANTAKSKHEYKTESGKMPDEISRLQNKWDEGAMPATQKTIANTSAKPSTTQAHDGYDKHITKKGTVYFTDKFGGRFWENESGKLIKI